MLYLHRIVPAEKYRDKEPRFGIVDTDDATETLVTYDDIEDMFIASYKASASGIPKLQIYGITVTRSAIDGLAQISDVKEYNGKGRLPNNRIKRVK